MKNQENSFKNKIIKDVKDLEFKIPVEEKKEDIDGVEEEQLRKCEEWSQKIYDISSKMKNIKNLNDCQIELINRRTELIEERLKISCIYNKFLKISSERKSDLMRKIKTKETLRLKTSTDFQILFDSECKELNYKDNLFKNYLDFLGQTLMTIDKLLFAVKNRIDIFNLEIK